MPPRTSRSNWPLVDTVYCEAKCPDEDVYYFGSDDDQYESPRERKRRYELAGKRFLGGSAPRLFSASLRGPFESSRGWKNPWTSKTQATRIAQQPEPKIPCATKSPTPVKTTKRHAKHLPTHTRFDRAKCHLPSPQSLKTASLSAGAHPFLEDEELQAVQAWRHNIRSTEPDAVQQSTPSATSAVSPLKRKAGHNWLKTVPDKRTRIERIENDAEGRSEICNPALPDLSIQGGGRASLATKTLREPNTRFSPRNSTSQLISPPKQSLAARNTARSPILIISKPSDEPSQGQQAAATLSSPVSLRNVKQENPDAQPSPLKFKAKSHITSNASELPHAPSPNATAIDCTVSNGAIQKPYRVPDDEDFVFDIAMAPPSDSSESEDEESSGELEHATEAALEELEPSALNEKPGAETDGSSDSDLTELSGSPELSDVEAPAESEAESVEAFDEMGDDSSEAPAVAETEMVDVEAASESMVTTEEVQVELPTGAEESTDWEGFSSAEDASEMGKTADASTASAIPGVALEEEAGLLAHNESHDASDSEISLPRQDDAEAEAEPNAADLVSSPAVAEDECVQSKLRVTETSTHSVAEPAVPPSPKVKQESSEFSLGAMLRSFVPAKFRGQLTHRSSGPPQATMQEPVAPATREHILPSVEDVHSNRVSEEDDFAEERERTHMSIERDSATEEQLTTSNTGAVSANEGDKPFQHSLPENALTSEKLPTSRHQTVEQGDTPMTTLGLNQMASRDEATAENETAGPVAVAGVSQEPPNTPSGQETTPAPCTATDETPPPVEAPATPVTAKTPLTARKVTNSEPRFAFKSFSAFTTPSPERLRVKKRRTLTGSSLRQARLKSILSSGHAGSARRTSNRVSWLLPDEQDTEDGRSQGKVDTSHDTPSSPPPRTPLAELPTAANEKFAKHFSSVVKRTDGLRHRFHVAADTDRGVGSLVSSSQTSSIVAKSKGTVDVAKEGTAVVASSNDVENQSRPREATLSVEPMDMVEDMVREMGDFWQAWDVDAELNAAKKAQTEAAATGSQSQTAWR